MDNIKRILAWLFMSSQDPKKVSATVKGLLLGGVTVATFLLGLQDVVVAQSLWTAFIDQTVDVIQIGLMLVSSLMTLFGLFRKIIITITGEHPLGVIIR